MRFNKRGISPLIATVLVIGFTIVLAGIVMQFLIPLFTNATKQSQEDSVMLGLCNQFGTTLTVKEATADSGNLKIIIDNPSNADIATIAVKYYDDAGNAGSCDTIEKLAAGAIVTKTIACKDAAKITKIEITPSVYSVATKTNKICSSIVIPSVVNEGIVSGGAPQQPVPTPCTTDTECTAPSTCDTAAGTCTP